MKRFKEFLAESAKNDDVEAELDDLISTWNKKMDDIEAGFQYLYPTDRNEDWREEQKNFRRKFLDMLDRDDVRGDENKRIGLIGKMIEADPTVMLEPNIPFEDLSPTADLLMVADPRHADPRTSFLPKYYKAREEIEQGKVMTSFNPATGKPFTVGEMENLSAADKKKIMDFHDMEKKIGGKFKAGHVEYGIPNHYWIGPDRLPSNVIKRQREGTIGQNLANLRSLGASGIAAAGAVAGGALTHGAEAATDVLGAYGAPPTPKDRMQIEKSFNSDIGMGFELSPEGELEASPEGFRAVSQRQKKGINFPTMIRGMNQ
jgi:hypothetical protein